MAGGGGGGRESFLILSSILPTSLYVVHTAMRSAAAQLLVR